MYYVLASAARSTMRPSGSPLRKSWNLFVYVCVVFGCICVCMILCMCVCVCVYVCVSCLVPCMCVSVLLCCYVVLLWCFAREVLELLVRAVLVVGPGEVPGVQYNIISYTVRCYTKYTPYAITTCLYHDVWYYSIGGNVIVLYYYVGEVVCLYYIIVLYCTISYNTIQHNIILYNIIQYNSI